jgi:hypothetical protein
MKLLNPTYFFLMPTTREAGKYFSRKIFFMPFQVPTEPGRMEKSHALLPLLKRKGKLLT